MFLQNKKKISIGFIYKISFSSVPWLIVLIESLSWISHLLNTNKSFLIFKGPLQLYNKSSSLCAFVLLSCALRGSDIYSCLAMHIHVHIPNSAKTFFLKAPP